MEITEFDYELPEELIAQSPLEERDSSRLMVVDRAGGRISHEAFPDISTHLRPGDLLVLNDTRVMPARLFGRRSTGGRIELLVVEVTGPERAKCMVNPSRRVREGVEILFDRGFAARVRGRGPDGFFVCEFTAPAGERLEDLLDLQGAMPLPPYIKRPASDADRERYQTVFARKTGAVAAPTAGLHFTTGLLERLRNSGVAIEYVTLHTGPGTFMPVRTEKVEDHRMHSERYSIEPRVFEKVMEARAGGGRVVAVGSTSTRALEASVQDGFDNPALSGSTDIFIYPGYTFKVVDAMVTNFHLPRSTLLMLVAAFAGRELIMKAYHEAVARRYRFFSYGDAMLIT